MYNLFLWKQVYKKGEILKYTILTLQVNKQMKGFLHFQMPFFTKYRNDNKEHKVIDDQNAFWFIAQCKDLLHVYDISQILPP